MTNYNREIAFEILGYPKYQTIAGMAANDLPKLKEIERHLENAYALGQAEERQRCADICEKSVVMENGHPICKKTPFELRDEILKGEAEGK